MALRITVNGESRELADLDGPSGLDLVVAHLGLLGDRIAIEHNGQISPRANWKGVAIADGDRLEIVHFVGGGTEQVG